MQKKNCWGFLAAAQNRIAILKPCHAFPILINIHLVNYDNLYETAMQIINYNNQILKTDNEQGIQTTAIKRKINEKPIKTNYKNITKPQVSLINYK